MIYEIPLFTRHHHSTTTNESEFLALPKTSVLFQMYWLWLYTLCMYVYTKQRLFDKYSSLYKYIVYVSLYEHNINKIKDQRLFIHLYLVILRKLIAVCCSFYRFISSVLKYRGARVHASPDYSLFVRDSPSFHTVYTNLLVKYANERPANVNRRYEFHLPAKVCGSSLSV